MLYLDSILMYWYQTLTNCFYMKIRPIKSRAVKWNCHVEGFLKLMEMNFRKWPPQGQIIKIRWLNQMYLNGTAVFIFLPYSIIILQYVYNVCTLYNFYNQASIRYFQNYCIKDKNDNSFISYMFYGPFTYLLSKLT